MRLWRGGLQQTTTGPNFVVPGGPAPGSDPGEALTNQWRRPADLLPPNFIRDGEPWLWEYPSTCFYTFQYLTDILGADAPPFGLLSVPVGGTMLEEWASPAAQAQCTNVTCMCFDDKAGCDPYGPLSDKCTKNSDMYFGSVQPFLNMTIRGWIWCAYREKEGVGGQVFASRAPSVVPALPSSFCRPRRKQSSV
jgi:hypothetical protein